MHLIVHMDLWILKPTESFGDTRCFMPCRGYRGSHYENNVIKMMDNLKDYVNSDIGSLPWQLNYVQRTGRVNDRD